jgi:hypothetical protein
MKINENKAIATVCKRMSTSTQKFKRPDLVFESVNPETGKLKWELVEITCPWPWIDDDGETLEKAFRKKVGKYNILRADLKREFFIRGHNWNSPELHVCRRRTWLVGSAM